MVRPYALRELVKAVYIGAPDKSSGKRRQGIRIVYDLVGYIPLDELMKQENGMTEAMPSLQKFEDTFLWSPGQCRRNFFKKDASCQRRKRGVPAGQSAADTQDR